MALREFLDRIHAIDTKKKVVLLLLTVVSIASVILLIVWAQSPTYQVLYSNLQPDDAGLIVQKLRDMKIPYKTTATGIMVPAERVYELRIQLASMGLPQGGGVGFEIFDKTGLGTTEFVQKVNLRRALQGELARTIRSLQEVKDCRIHLTIPERSIFTASDERPKASVLLKLQPGVTLTKKQVQGIIHLVSSSVEGLVPENVTVIDSRGNVLSSPSGESALLTTTQLEYQRSIEKDIEKRVVEILTPVVGRNRVRAKANVNVDFTRVEETKELFDPDSQVVRSEQKQLESRTTSTPSGVPGVKSNIPGRTQAVGSTKSGVTKQTEPVNYEISKIRSHVIKPTGVVKRITVAVLVDGIYKKDEKTGKMIYTPRTEEELRTYEELVKKAIGFSGDRSDEVKVVSMPFKVEEEQVYTDSTGSYERYLIPAVRYATILILSLLAFLFLIRPLMKYLKSAPSSVSPTYGPAATAEIESSTKELKRLPQRDEIKEWAKGNPQQAAHLIKKWIHGG